MMSNLNVSLPIYLSQVLISLAADLADDFQSEPDASRTARTVHKPIRVETMMLLYSWILLIFWKKLQLWKAYHLIPIVVTGTCDIDTTANTVTIILPIRWQSRLATWIPKWSKSIFANIRILTSSSRVEPCDPSHIEYNFLYKLIRIFVGEAQNGFSTRSIVSNLNALIKFNSIDLLDVLLTCMYWFVLTKSVNTRKWL